MLRQNSSLHSETTLPAAAEMERLVSLAEKWGMEAGYLDIDGRIDERILLPIRAASERIFGGTEIDRKRLAPRLEYLEAQYTNALRIRDFYRERYLVGNGDANQSGGILRGLRTWFSAWLECQAASLLLRRRGPELQKLHADLYELESRGLAAQEWEGAATMAVKANYEYQKTRAALARPRREMSRDSGEALRVIYRAN